MLQVGVLQLAAYYVDLPKHFLGITCTSETQGYKNIGQVLTCLVEVVYSMKKSDTRVMDLKSRKALTRQDDV